jgi:hypothetical protein
MQRLNFNVLPDILAQTDAAWTNQLVAQVGVSRCEKLAWYKSCIKTSPPRKILINLMMRSVKSQGNN